jgi:hypothetical protein
MRHAWRNRIMPLTHALDRSRNLITETWTGTGLPRVSRADVAAVLLRQLEDPRYMGRGIQVAS